MTKVTEATVPSKYWAQGKFYFITNSSKDRFFVSAENNSESDGDWISTDLKEATCFANLKDARGKINAYKKYARPDFGKGRQGLELFQLWQNAQIGVLIYRARDLRIATHLEQGDPS